DGIKQCTDGTDELASYVNWDHIHCSYFDLDECNLIKQSNIIEYLISFTKLCNTIWDVKYGLDEMNCTEWICDEGWLKYNRTDERNQAMLWNGNCIERHGVCNDVQQFPDGSDEFYCNHQEMKEIPCRNVTSPTQIIDISFNARYLRGNGVIDCIGGQDERNTYSCEDGSPLKDRYLCANGNCIREKYLCE
ncbi:unnamed protein product, partial [Didymodactylos carnosus]